MVMTLIAAHAKLGIDEGRPGKMLIHPMKCTTIWAANIDISKTIE